MLADTLAAKSKEMLPLPRPYSRAQKWMKFDGWVRNDGEEFTVCAAAVITLYTEFFHEPVEMRVATAAYYGRDDGAINVVSTSDEDRHKIALGHISRLIGASLIRPLPDRPRTSALHFCPINLPEGAGPASAPTPFRGLTRAPYLRLDQSTRLPAYSSQSPYSGTWSGYFIVATCAELRSR